MKNTPSFLKKMVKFKKNTPSFSENFKVFLYPSACTYASGYTYGGIGLHVYTYRATRTYASAYTYIAAADDKKGEGWDVCFPICRLDYEGPSPDTRCVSQNKMRA